MSQGRRRRLLPTRGSSEIPMRGGGGGGGVSVDSAFPEVEVAEGNAVVRPLVAPAGGEELAWCHIACGADASSATIWNLSVKAHTEAHPVPVRPCLAMSAPAIHSLAGVAAPPPPATATPALRRATTACPLRESRQPAQAHPNLSSRRGALLVLILAASPPRPAAAAFSLGIPGPKELLREQKKKSARFLLAPISASRDTLLKAQALLASANASADDAEEVKGRVTASGRDCVPRERNSIVAFQSRTGVEVCTFSLILKNAASLLDDKDPLKVEADTRLAELIQSFSNLGSAVENSNFEVPDDREKMKDDLLSTIAAIDRFEQSVKDCLGI